MNSEMKYYQEDYKFSAKENETEKISKELQHILELESFLSLEDKVILRRVLREKSLF